MNKDQLIHELITTHNNMKKIEKTLQETREKRRKHAQQLITTHGLTQVTIAQHLGITKQAVDQLLKYKTKKSERTTSS